MLRIGAVPHNVYKQRGQFTQLAFLAKADQMLVSDDVRVQNRIKSLLRSRGDGEPRATRPSFMVVNARHGVAEYCRP
jgi:hypothetical protein